MSKLVIAEKPMLARDIARAITGKEVSESARLPISGNGYTVCACAGHLLELVKRDEAIAHHVTRKFYELFASGDSDAGKLTFKYLPGKELLAGEKHLFERHTLEALKERLC